MASTTAFVAGCLCQSRLLLTCRADQAGDICRGHVEQSGGLEQVDLRFLFVEFRPFPMFNQESRI